MKESKKHLRKEEKFVLPFKTTIVSQIFISPSVCYHLSLVGQIFPYFYFSETWTLSRGMEKCMDGTDTSFDVCSKPLLEMSSNHPPNLHQSSRCFLSHTSSLSTVCWPMPLCWQWGCLISLILEAGITAEKWFFQCFFIPLQCFILQWLFK